MIEVPFQLNSGYGPLMQQALETIQYLIFHSERLKMIDSNVETFVAGCERVEHNENDALSYILSFATNFPVVFPVFIEIAKMYEFFRNKSVKVPDDEKKTNAMFALLEMIQNNPVKILKSERVEMTYTVEFMISPELGTISIIDDLRHNGPIMIGQMIKNEVQLSASLNPKESFCQCFDAAILRFVAKLSTYWGKEINNQPMESI